MKKQITKLILATILALTGVFTTLSSAPTHAANVCNQSGVSQDVLDAAGCNKTADKLPGVITIILNSIIGISGLVAVVFIIIGGINYMTSNGDTGKLKKAKDTILYAAIGLIICALAFAIVNWVIGTALKQTAVIISKSLLI